MIDYDIFFSCKACGEEHPLGVRIPLADGPSEKMSIAAFYAEAQIPETIRRISNQPFVCPKSRTRFFHNDITRLYLVPVV